MKRDKSLLIGMSQLLQKHHNWLLFAVPIEPETEWEQDIFGIATSLTRWKYFIWSLILDLGHCLAEMVIWENRKHSTLLLSWNN